MQKLDDVERYVADLRREMKADPGLARRVSEEIRQHLEEAVEERVRGGLDIGAAQAEAIRALGSPREVAAQYPGLAGISRGLLLAASIFSLLISGWLVTVLLFVLPGRNEDQIPFWTLVCAGFAGYGLVSIAYAQGILWQTWARLTLSTLSLAGVGAGAFATWSQADRAAHGGDFEGYIFLMGLGLAAHGALFLAYSFLTRRNAGAPAR